MTLVDRVRALVDGSPPEVVAAPVDWDGMAARLPGFEGPVIALFE